jgi:formate hydrogenlyase subunit 3/multisubunit Na+/H+ antiporter MnhD subunit
MPPALWLIALPLGAAPIVYLLRRIGVGAIVAAGITLLSAWLVLKLPTNITLSLLGRPIALNPLSQVSLALIFAATASLFLTLTLLSFTTERRIAHFGKSTGQEGRVFYPSALIILGLFVAASLSQHLGITAIFIELAAILMVFVIQAQRLESTRAALRFLILISLATPAFLLAAWQIDRYQLSGGVTSLRSIDQIALLIGFGFAVWLAVIPFHGWLTSTATESSPPTAAFVLITFPIVAFSTLINLLVDLPWLADSSYFIDAVIVAGTFTAFIGGILASVQRGFSELMGYTALFNLGCILTILGIGSQAAVITILVSLTVRAVALVLIAASLSTIYLGVTGDGFAQLKGVAQQMPIATMGLLIGGLTLAGAPFTAGFAPFWQLLHSIAEIEERWLALFVFGALGVAIGYLRASRIMLSPVQPIERRVGRGNSYLGLGFTEPILLMILISLLGVVCIIFGVFPSPLIELLQPISNRVLLIIR